MSPKVFLREFLAGATWRWKLVIRLKDDLKKGDITDVNLESREKTRSQRTPA